jgi:hypothetical protein
MTLSIEVGGPADLEHVFGILGRAVGPRTGRGNRTHDEKEWWCLRRYIFTLSAAGQLEFPISIRKGERPDFRCEFGSRPVGIEVTQATDAQDQKATTKLQQSDASQALVGSFGGRFPRGGGNPELAWQRDVLEAVRSKSQNLDHYQDPLPEHVLLLYSNSNAASLIHDAMWPSVFSGCNPMNEQLWKLAPSRLKSIGIICGPWLVVLRSDRVQTYPLRSG